MKLSRISRVVKILTSIQAGHHYSADDLAAVVGVSRRTIFRDLRQLEAIGVPFLFDSKQKGYHISPEFFLPPVDLNIQEALSLLLLVHKTRNHLPVPFKNSSLLAGLKIENNLPENIRRYCNMTLQNISVRPDSYAPMNGLDKVFTLLQDAIRKQQNVVLSYQSLYDHGEINTTLQPYHLIYNSRAWYVIGRSSFHKGIRTFKLNRIKSLEARGNGFVQEKGFDVYEYLGRAWSMIPEGKIYQVRLRFSPKVAQNVTEVQWHSTQKSSINSDGTADVEFRVDGLGEIVWWILGYGDQVEVLAPQVLRKRISETATKAAQLNSAI